MPERHPEAVRSWLIGRLANYVERPPEDIDPDASLAGLGLDSVYAFALCGEIEDHLGLPIEPVVLWDLDTVTALAGHLMRRLAPPAGSDPA
ncbi:acyl carrier protein [Dactylosporangium vinaceum]|uniref:Acyl carrier protein n=1 Tax=Dactylosporangium vinaceum TaxID=53362 RepID=A0ABV5M2S6_9ACTN|nr:acyl carrier protein [Dactylosporangium vinaceum]UAB99891.1 acyl carrier protein [Dactylosporangium vinaceum]